MAAAVLVVFSAEESTVIMEAGSIPQARAMVQAAALVDDDLGVAWDVDAALNIRGRATMFTATLVPRQSIR